MPVFAVFIPALILPGPDFVGVVRSSVTRGTTAGLLTTLGVSIGLGFYATLSLLGLSAILVEYQWLTWAVRVLGGLYLAWLGIKLLRGRRTRTATDDDTPEPPLSDRRAFGVGFGTALCLQLFGLLASQCRVSNDLFPRRHRADALSADLGGLYCRNDTVIS